MRQYRLPDAPAPAYDGNPDWLIDPDLSGVAGVPTKYWKIVGDDVVEMDAAEKSVVDAAELDAAKEKKLKEISSRTQELILQGFQYNAKTFGLGPERRLQIVGAQTFKDRLVYPKAWRTKDGLDVIQIADAVEMEAFALTGLGTYEALLTSDEALSDQVAAAATIADVDAVVDNR